MVATLHVAQMQINMVQSANRGPADSGNQLEHYNRHSIMHTRGHTTLIAHMHANSTSERSGFQPACGDC